MSLGATSPFDTLTGSPLASQSFVNSVLGPPIVGWALQVRDPLFPGLNV